MRVILATRNPGKLEEVKNIFSGSGIEIVGMEEAGAVGEGKEDGDTLVDNACKKARFVKEQFPKEWVVADDTGLFVRALNSKPGVHSARWAGENVTTLEITRFLLAKMAWVPAGKRHAYFETVTALFSPEPENDYFIFSGRVSGVIALQVWGKAKPGMPYDPVFIPDGRDCTFAEMSPEEKNFLSSRGRAFRTMKEFLESYLKLDWLTLGLL